MFASFPFTFFGEKLLGILSCQNELARYFPQKFYDQSNVICIFFQKKRQYNISTKDIFLYVSFLPWNIMDKDTISLRNYLGIHPKSDYNSKDKNSEYEDEDVEEWWVREARQEILEVKGMEDTRKKNVNFYCTWSSTAVPQHQ